MIALIGAGCATLFLILTLVRLLAGPTLYDRALAASSALSKAILICAAVAAVLGRAAWADAALALAFGALVVSVAALKFFRAGTFQAPLVRARERP